MSSDQCNLEVRSTVVFNQVRLNKGEAYCPSTGFFTCPEDGVYSFTCNLTTKPGHVLHTMLAVDGKDVARCYRDLLSTKNCFMSTKNVLVAMKEGEKAWIRPCFQGCATLLWGDHHGFASFNGHKTYFSNKKPCFSMICVF